MKKIITTMLIVALIFTMCSTVLATGEKVTAGIKIGTAGETAAVNVTYSGTESLTLLKV